MKKFMSLAMVAVIALAYTAGCSAPQMLTRSEAPLKVDYQIRYSDSTALEVMLLMITPNISTVNEKTLHRLDEAVEQVSRELPKSSILERQDEFRDRLQLTFAEKAPEVGPVRLVIVGFNESQWDVPSSGEMLSVR